MVQTWTDVLAASLQEVYLDVALYLPKLLGALIILLIGLIVSSGIRTLIERIVEALKVDGLLVKMGVNEYVERAGLRLNSGKLLGGLVYWFLLIAFLLASADLLDLEAFSQFLRDVLAYLPNVFVAVLVMLAAVVLGNFLKNLVMASVMSARLHAAQFLGSLTWWAVVMFGFFTALLQLQIAVQIVQTLITGFIAMIAIAGGIAFGLGGKSTAEDVLAWMRREVTSK